MRLTFLGTGTSFGVPVIGCSCPTCSSDDPRNKRTRHGALVELPDGTLLVDTPPELRLQLLSAGVSQVDAVFFTHLHADHIHGIDDVRVFSTKGRGAMPAYIPTQMRDDLVSRFSYIFDPQVIVPEGTTKPRIELRDYDPGVPISLLGDRLLPFRVPHGPSDAFGFRVNGLGYVTDACELPDPALDALQGVEVLVLNALWWGDPHPTHFTVEQAIAAAEQVGARRTYLTHLTHRVEYESLAAKLPAGIEPAYDGLTVEVG